MRQTKRTPRRMCNVMTDSKDFIRIHWTIPRGAGCADGVATPMSHETPILLRERRMAHLNTPNGDAHARLF
jgi:hypothetical protein